MVWIAPGPRDRDAVYVPMHDLTVQPEFSGQLTAEPVGDHDRAVAAAGAADGHGEVAFALFFETWQTKFEQARGAFQKLGGIRTAEYVLPYGLAGAGKLAEFGHEMRVFEEPHVEHQ